VMAASPPLPPAPTSKLWIWVGWRCSLETREVASKIAARVSDYFDVAANDVHIAVEAIPRYDPSTKKLIPCPHNARSTEEVEFWKDMGIQPPWPKPPPQPPAQEEGKSSSALVPITPTKPKKGLWRNLSPQRIKNAAAQTSQASVVTSSVTSPSPPPLVGTMVGEDVEEDVEAPLPDIHELPALHIRLKPNEEAFRDKGFGQQSLGGFQFMVEKYNIWCQHDLKRTWLLLICAPETMYLWVGNDVIDAAGQVRDALKCAQLFLGSLI
jgi:hypothetical protein